jgi:hypothetical protein
LFFSALNFAHRTFVAFEVFALAAADITRFLTSVTSLEVGKAANLIVTNGDPLELTTDVKYLFIKGQLTSRDNKQKRLSEKYLSRPKP